MSRFSEGSGILVGWRNLQYTLSYLVEGILWTDTSFLRSISWNPWIFCAKFSPTGENATCFCCRFLYQNHHFQVSNLSIYFQLDMRPGSSDFPWHPWPQGVDPPWSWFRLTLIEQGKRCGTNGEKGTSCSGKPEAGKTPHGSGKNPFSQSIESKVALWNSHCFSEKLKL